MNRKPIAAILAAAFSATPALAAQNGNGKSLQAPSLVQPVTLATLPLLRPATVDASRLALPAGSSLSRPLTLEANPAMALPAPLQRALQTVAVAASGPAANSGPKALAATLGSVEKAMAGMPDPAKAGSGDVRGGGDGLQRAMTGESASVAAAGSVAGTPADDGGLKLKVKKAKETAEKILAEVSKVIVGQTEMKRAILMAMIAREHVLLEGLPGVAKTQTAKAFADAVEGGFNRVQGTADRLPSDVTGSEIYRENTGTFELVKGPVFTNILLMDEINRMPPKAQSALLEAMAEGQVTIGGKTLKLNRFTVLATQNPVEQDGTYRLPEAQLDRFMFKVLVPQPTAEDLKRIIRLNASKDARPQASKVTTLDELDEMRRVADSLTMSEEVEDYVVRVAMAASRPDLKSSVDYTVYTRAAIYLAQAARINALLHGRDFVSPADVREVAPLVLRHRIALTYAAQAEGNIETVIETILGQVPTRTIPAAPAATGQKPKAQ